MTVNNEHFVKLADDAAEKAFEMISQIANLRLECLANEFRLSFPKKSFSITFVDRSQSISLNGIPLLKCDLFSDEITLICIAVEDVRKITNNYRRGCPNDLEVLPDDSELQGGPDVENEIITIRKAVGSDIRSYEERSGYHCPRPGSPGDAVHIQ